MAAWTRRPSLTTARLIAFGLALLCALAGWLLMVFYEQFALWLLLTLLAIWVGLKVGPWFVKRLEAMGLFGRVRLDRDDLSAGRGAGALDLAREFRVTARLQQKVVEHEFRLRDAGVGTIRSAKRTERKAVSILQATVEQDDTRWNLVADDTRAPPLPSYDVSGLSCRTASVAKPAGRVIRMHVVDLIALLHHMKDAQGYRAVTAPDTDDVSGDPRKLFWPGWKSLVGVGVLLALGIAVSVKAMDHAPGESPAARPEPLTVEQREEAWKAEAQSRGQAWVGKSVGFTGTKPHYVYGIVRSFEATPSPEGRQAKWTVTLSVEITRVLDHMMEPAPKGQRARVQSLEREVEIGSVVEIAPDEVYESEGP